MISINCVCCGNTFTVNNGRKNTAKFCSRVCSDTHPRTKNFANCINCGKKFGLKRSAVAKNKWNCCSLECNSMHRKKFVAGENNPNYKGKNVDSDGYRISIPEVNGIRVKLHRYNAYKSLGLKSVPSGFHVHHRDCDVLNNDPCNLSIMTMSDHNWLHKQFGNATLWAFMREKISIDELKSWSDNPERAERLLIADVCSQGAIISAGSMMYGMDAHQSIARLYPVKAIFIQECYELSETKRGSNGLGSTGA